MIIDPSPTTEATRSTDYGLGQRSQTTSRRSHPC